MEKEHPAGEKLRKLMNLADNENNSWAPSKDSRVCSKHSADGKHTFMNLNLTILFASYDTKNQAKLL